VVHAFPILIVVYNPNKSISLQDNIDVKIYSYDPGVAFWQAQYIIQRETVTETKREPR
jgi:hypothetical protein